VAVNSALFALLASVIDGSAVNQAPAKVRITTWNLECLPNERRNGSELTIDKGE